MTAPQSITDPADRREYERGWMKAWRERNPEKLRAYRAKRNVERRGALNLKYSRKAVFGVSPQVVVDMLEAQDGACAICSKRLTLPHLRTHLDHDHRRKGRLRGVLCHNCNLGLGHFKDRPDLLRSAAGYLEVFA